jgi:hypothetical protein
MADVTESLRGAIVHLSSDEAVVMLALLSRWMNDTDKAAPSGACFESSSECAVLHELFASLERQLMLTDSDYARTVEGARERLSGYWEGTSLRPTIGR